MSSRPEGDRIMMEGAAVDGELQDALPLFGRWRDGAEPHQFEVDDGARLEMLVHVVVARPKASR